MKLCIIICLFAALLISCSTDDSTPTSPVASLVLLESFNLSVIEPSDLSYDADSNCLWTVSDNSNKVYQLDLEGYVLAELPYTGDDLEGVFYDATSQSLWVAEEGSSQIVNLTTSGVEISRHDIPLASGTNIGLEGICLNQTGDICLVKEKDPGIFYRLNSNFVVDFQLELDFAGDFAAITFDEERDCFWIVSDQDQSVYLWNETDGVTKEFSLPFPKPEGITLIPNTAFVYFVSDSENMLYRMELKEN